jgi:multiple sugar transport system permease protein
MSRLSWTKSIKAGRTLQSVLAYVALAVLMFWILFPFYWMVNSSFKPNHEIFDFPPTWLPKEFTIEHYKWALTNNRFIRPLLNSIQVALMTTAVATPLSALAAYAMARYPIPRKRALMGVLVATQMIPGVLLVIPLFITFTRLGIINKYSGLALGYSTFIFPYAVLQMRAFFANFPLELEDAAMIDGCTQLGAFLRVTLPLSIPGVVTVGLFAILIAWNDLLFSLILTSDINAMTVAVQLYNLSMSQFASTNWGVIIAEATIITLPVVILFVFLQKFLIQGLTAGAIKG